MRIVLRLVLLFAALWGAGKLVAGRLTEGDASTDEFSLAAVLGGLERRCRATALCRGRVLALCGGVQLDLREATLAKNGGRLTVRAILGGVQVIVPAGWRVIVEADARAGGVDAGVTPPESLPADAPTLLVEAVARLGGIAVTSDDGPERAPAP